MRNYLDNLRSKMALKIAMGSSADGDGSSVRSGGLIELSVLSVIVGLLAGLVMVALNLALQWLPQISIGGEPFLEHADGFESLPPLWRLLIPLGGGLLLGLIFQLLKQHGEVGIPHVIASLAKRDGQMPFSNAVVQFFAAIFALLSGQSMGKEGPAVHIGAASGSRFSNRAGLPHTATRVLVASGAAAAIAAAFDTPLAGVVFAMEVILMEYTIAGFAPVILATVAATATTRIPVLILGADYASSTELAVPDGLAMQSLAELPWLLFCGLVIGAVAAGFVYGIKQLTLVVRRVPIWLRFTLAGLVTGTLGVFLPQVLGIGYDSLTTLLSTEATLTGLDIGPELLLLCGFLLAKCIATGVSVSMGMPAGLIGPTLLMGGILGCLLGWVGNLLLPGEASPPGFYALVGMGAMMAAVLQAPLAALLALVELTGNPDVVFPAMLTTVAGYLVCRAVLKQPPIFRMLLQRRGHRYRTDPITQGLRHSTVMEAMDRQVRMVEDELSTTQAQELLELKLAWLVFTVKDHRRLLAVEKIVETLTQQDDPDALLKLADFTSSTLQVQEIDWRMTLLTARDRFDDGVEALLVTTQHRRLGKQILGVITPATLQQYIRTSLH